MHSGQGFMPCSEVGSFLTMVICMASLGMGLVSEVFDEGKLQKLPGSCAIGHVRYATAGASVLKNVQPFVAASRQGALAVAHNGNLVNYSELRGKLEESGSIFNTSSDTEVGLMQSVCMYLKAVQCCGVHLRSRARWRARRLFSYRGRQPCG